MPHTYIPTYLHTYILTYIHTYILTYLHTYIPTYLHTYIPTYLHTYIPTYLHTYIPRSPLFVSRYCIYRELKKQAALVFKNPKHSFLPFVFPAFLSSSIVLFQLQKGPSNISNNLMTSMNASCFFLGSHKAGTLYNLFPLELKFQQVCWICPASAKLRHYRHQNKFKIATKLKICIYVSQKRCDSQQWIQCVCLQLTPNRLKRPWIESKVGKLPQSV